MQSSLQMIREKYGSAEGYMKQCCGLSDGDIATIRQNMTSSDTPIL